MTDNYEDGLESPPDPRQPPPGYKVGPKNPPYETRWGKGEPSPNPRGRPPKKHLKGLFDELDPLAAQVIEFDQKGTGVIDAAGNEHTRATAYLTAVHLQSTQNPRFAELYERMRSAAYAEKKKLTEAVLEGALFHRWRYMEAFVEADRLRRRPPDILPDPRDIIVGSDGTVKIVGPMDYEQLQITQAAVRLRNYAFEGLELIDEMDTDPETALAARAYLIRHIYRLHRNIPPRLRKRIPPMRGRHEDFAAE